jgi:hypothetical protein
MDAKTLAKIVQIVVQEEVGKIVRKEMATLKKQIVAEVKKSIPKQKVVREQVPMGSALQGTNFDIPDVLPQRQPVQEKKLSHNPTINSILNETAGFSDSNEFDEYPTMGGNAVTQNNAMGGDASQFRQMMAEKMGITPPGQSGNLSVQEMLPKTNPEGMPLQNVNVPDAVAKALTRDYTDLVKAMKK